MEDKNVKPVETTETTETKETTLEESREQMINTETFLEGKEPTVIEKSEPTEEVKKEIDLRPDLKTMSEFLNEGIEDDNQKIIFDETVFQDKKEDGTAYSSDERKSAVIKSILDKTTLGSTPEVDSFVRELIIKSHEENFNLDEYKNSMVTRQEPMVDVSDTNDIVKRVYMTKYGPGTNADLTEEEIEGKLTEISTADKKLIIADFKDAVTRTNNEKQAERAKEQEQVFLGRVDKYNSDTKLAVESFIEQSKNKDVFSGFKFGESDKQDYINDIPTFMKRELETTEAKDTIAISPAEKVLQDIIKDPQSLLDLIPFLWLKHKGKLEGYSTMLTEKVKWDMLERLDNTPQHQSQNTGKKALDIEHMIDNSNVSLG